MIDTSETKTQAIEDALKNIPKDENQIQRLVELLEGRRFRHHYPRDNQYQVFCAAYLMKLVQIYVPNKDEQQILLAMYRLLDGYDNEIGVTDRRKQYFNKALGSNKRLKSTWTNPVSALQKIEKDLAADITKRVVEGATDNDDHKGWLNLANVVIKELSERFPNGLPSKLPLPQPSYLSPLPVPKASQPLDLPPVEELFPTGKEIVLIPGEIFELKVAILPREAVDAPLSFVSLDPSIVTVSTSGMLKAEKKPQKLLHNIKNSRFLGALLGRAEATGTDSQTVEIVIQAESGVTASKPVVVDYTRGCYEPPVSDINDYVPDFRVSQKVRLAGDTTWHNYVDAKIGDRLEFQTQYFNTDFFGNTHENVAMRAILPSNLRYVQGSTLLFTTKTPNGMAKEDGIAGNGIYIGTYGVNSNAYVRFTAEVVDENLACDTTGLVNWVQACVNGVTLQDFTTVHVSK